MVVLKQTGIRQDFSIWLNKTNSLTIERALTRIQCQFWPKGVSPKSCVLGQYFWDFVDSLG